MLSHQIECIMKSRGRQERERKWKGEGDVDSGATLAVGSLKATGKNVENCDIFKWQMLWPSAYGGNTINAAVKAAETKSAKWQNKTG